MRPFVDKHLSFSRELRNDERFTGPFYFVSPTARRLEREGSPWLLGDANTLVVRREERTFIGEYKYERSGGTYGLNAYRITVELCLIDMKNPARRRVVVATSEPPSKIQDEVEYNERAIHTIDDKPDADRGPHNEDAIFEKALRIAGNSTP